MLLIGVLNAKYAGHRVRKLMSRRLQSNNSYVSLKFIFNVNGKKEWKENSSNTFPMVCSYDSV